jgi:hypothetical protein
MYEKEFIAIMSVVLYRVAGCDQIGVACLPACRERERERERGLLLLLSFSQLIS